MNASVSEAPKIYMIIEFSNASHSPPIPTYTVGPTHIISDSSFHYKSCLNLLSVHMGPAKGAEQLHSSKEGLSDST